MFLIFVYVDVNECFENNLCMNNGICFNICGFYWCVCFFGWIGKYCEKGNYIN